MPVGIVYCDKAKFRSRVVVQCVPPTDVLVLRR